MANMIALVATQHKTQTIPATIWMGGILVINLFLTVYCAVSVYQIKHSTTPSMAVQMEANQ